MLLDPFEKQFHLPSAPIQIGDGERRQYKVVGLKDQPPARLRILEANAPQRCLETFVRVMAREHNGLIADQPRSAIDGMRIAPLGLEVRLSANDEEAPRFVEAMQPLEIQKSTVHGRVFAGVARYTTTKCGQREIVGQLRKNQLACVHK